MEKTTIEITPLLLFLHSYSFSYSSPLLSCLLHHEYTPLILPAMSEEEEEEEEQEEEGKEEEEDDDEERIISLSLFLSL